MNNTGMIMKTDVATIKSEVFLQDCMDKKPNHWTGRKHSAATKEKIRLAMLRRVNPMHDPATVSKRSATLVDRGTFAGPNGNKWKGGGRKYRGIGWNKARNERRAIDAYQCADCGRPEVSLGRLLDVHHIIDFKDGGTNEMSNLVSLCRSCHNKRRNAGK